MDELTWNDLKCIEPQIKLLTSSLAGVNASMAKTFEKMDALHVELVRRSVETQIPCGNDKQNSRDKTSTGAHVSAPEGLE